MKNENLVKYGQILLFAIWGFLLFYALFQDISLGVEYYQP